MSDAYISFGLVAGITDADRGKTIGEITSINGVSKVFALKADSKSEAIRRLYFAQLEANADTDSVLKTIKNSGGVEFAEIPAPRYLIR